MYKNACNWLIHSTEPKNNWSLRHYEKSPAFQLAENTSGQLVGNINSPRVGKLHGHFEQQAGSDPKASRDVTSACYSSCQTTSPNSSENIHATIYMLVFPKTEHKQKDGSGKDDVPEVQHTGHKTGDKGIATSSRVCLGRSRNKNLEEHSIRSVDTGQGHTEGTSAIQKSSIPLGLSLLPISLQKFTAFWAETVTVCLCSILYKTVSSLTKLAQQLMEEDTYQLPH